MRNTYKLALIIFSTASFATISPVTSLPRPPTPTPAPSSVPSTPNFQAAPKIQYNNNINPYTNLTVNRAPTLPTPSTPTPAPAPAPAPAPSSVPSTPNFQAAPKIQYAPNQNPTTTATPTKTW